MAFSALLSFDSSNKHNPLLSAKLCDVLSLLHSTRWHEAVARWAFSCIDAAGAIEVDLCRAAVLAAHRAREDKHTATMTEVNAHRAGEFVHTAARDHLGGFASEIDIGEVETDVRKLRDTY